jgi:hypothetical protein
MRGEQLPRMQGHALRLSRVDELFSKFRRVGGEKVKFLREPSNHIERDCALEGSTGSCRRRPVSGDSDLELVILW